ncbi:hypothetical protein FQR65_LT14119 [Abscondita terminalis]|nr:hypothetical protein FQR65_LT14119 [Abscondita terminalis]
MVPLILKQILDPSINLEVVNGTNYRISGGLELLNASWINKELGKTQQLLSQLEVLTLIDSTNNYLLNKTEYIGNYAVFAEQQTTGRGQFKRTWYSNFGKNIALSLLWQISNPLNKLDGLTLAVGIAVVKALEQYGLKKIRLKWPNDIVYEGKKLAGILIESRSLEQKINKLVIGIGLNLYNPSTHYFTKDQAITSIFSLQNLPPKRNQLAAKGLSYFLQDWQRLDNLTGKLITIQNQANAIEGIAKGINTEGQLCVLIKNKLQYFNSGEIRNLEFKKSFSNFQPFKKMLVKLKKEIIPFGLQSINPEKFTAPYITPEMLNVWLENKPELVLLDTRNTFEIEYGSFRNSLNLDLKRFRDFPNAVKKLPEKLKHVPIVTFCTGGIRCEKAAVYLLENGYKEVYQLKGGILNYFEKCGENYFKGTCFVFDERESLSANLETHNPHYT